MKISDLMSRYVEFIEGDASVKDAAVMMGELDVGGIPVGSPQRLEGIVTDRDILFRVVARGLDPNVTKAREIVSRPVVACGAADSTKTVMDLMAAHHTRRMPVRDAEGLVSGWITLADLSRKLLVDSDTLQTALRDMTEASG